MNPFCTPDRIFISNAPQDMRAGIHRLKTIIITEFGMDPQDSALYVFVSRDCKKIKMLRFDVNGWCMYYLRPCEGGFNWKHDDKGDPLLVVQRRELLWLLEGMSITQTECAQPLDDLILL